MIRRGAGRGINRYVLDGGREGRVEGFIGCVYICVLESVIWRGGGTGVRGNYREC